ncbi:MAG: glycosyltransferase [Chloroflexi bacterium]|nr:glycosyltransferase [Chloroflexota bacterium]
MLGPVPTAPKSIEEYRAIIGDEALEEILDLARDLRGARVLHLNATAFGGGVAEILATLVPLMNDVGLQAHWQVITGADEFFQVTKAMHNSLQGMYIQWTPEMHDIWLRYNTLNADLFDEDWDFVVIHDPQPAGILAKITERLGHRPAGKWTWRCHIDLTDAQPDLWDFLRPYIEQYDAAIFTLEEYVKEELHVPHIAIVPPSIDPLSPKNADLPEGVAKRILERYGIDTGRPFICQVSRFDPWKDPLGVIDVYRLVKQQIPEVQLAMIASMASDDPEGWSYYERTARRAGEDFDIHLLSNINGVGNVEVNAFQREAAVVIQKSVREGFGLVVSEALWKGRPVVAGNVGGIPLQIIYGKTGYLVNTVPECADRVLYLMRNPKVADRMGRAGREYVRKHFLSTRNLRDYLALFRTIAKSAPVRV